MKNTLLYTVKFCFSERDMFATMTRIYEIKSLVYKLRLVYFSFIPKAVFYALSSLVLWDQITGFVTYKACSYAFGSMLIIPKVLLF